MFGFPYRFAAAAFALATGLSAPSHASDAAKEAYLELTPSRALRLASAATETPEIPGVTYPRKAPPDLLHVEMQAEVVPVAPEARFEPLALEAVSAGTSSMADKEYGAAVDGNTLKLDVDLTTQRLTVTERGEVKFVWAISSGRAPYATKTGTFRPQWASRMWYSRQYDMAPMPHAVFFNGGIAFHATNATHLLGRPASHGCVRLSPQNARALYTLIHAHGYAHTEITVAGRPQVAANPQREPDKRKPKPARISASPGPSPVWSLF